MIFRYSDYISRVAEHFFVASAPVQKRVMASHFRLLRHHHNSRANHHHRRSLWPQNLHLKPPHSSLEVPVGCWRPLSNQLLHHLGFHLHHPTRTRNLNPILRLHNQDHLSEEDYRCPTQQSARILLVDRPLPSGVDQWELKPIPFRLV